MNPASAASDSAHAADSETGEAEIELDVSIILPVYNEAEHLVQEVERVRAAMDASPYSYEIIVVDDGSTDNSAEVAAGIEGIRFLHFLQNRGSGSARKAGTKAARGRITVWTDVDMTYPNDTIPQLVKELVGYDQVVGARRSEEGTHKALRVPAKWLIRKLAEFLTATRIPDLNSGFRAFRTDVARQYLNQLPVGFSCVTTITMTFLANGYSVKYVPIDYAKRAGESKFHWYKDTRRYATQVVRMILSYNPLRIFMPVGSALFAIGIIKLLVDLIGRDFHVAADTLLILFAAFQVVAIGLLADLVTRATRARAELPPSTAGARGSQARAATPASVRS
jgi:glycosyltransferase involved in cell wall biosynthesis